jgi:hypothetical protein
MKTTDKKFNSALCLLIIQAILFTNVACSKKDFLSTEVKRQQKDRFPSATFNHFEDGVLFTDAEAGLNILWDASFKDGGTYKENMGYFINGGLLILPNKDNTDLTARPIVLPVKAEDGKLFVKFRNNYTQVFGIIHTHPEFHSTPGPTPRNDYQFSYLGIHNYVMNHLNLYDAYKDANGYEVYKRLGPRNAYHRIPLNELTGAYTEIFALEE